MDNPTVPVSYGVTSTVTTSTVGPVEAMVPVLDEEAAGITPDPDAPLHVNPYDAAKELRGHAKRLRLLVTEFLGAKSLPPLNEAKAYIGHTLSRMDRAQKSNQLVIDNYYGLMDQRLVTLLDKLATNGELATAIKNRKSMDGRKLLVDMWTELASLRSDMRSMMDTVRTTRGYLSRASEYGNVVQKALLNTPTASPETTDAEQKEEIKHLCDEIHKLAQSLPTIANGPVEKNQMILRAIATLLKNGGYLTTSITTEAEHAPV